MIRKPDVVVWSWPWISLCFGWTYTSKASTMTVRFGWTYTSKASTMTVCIGFLTLRWHW